MRPAADDDFEVLSKPQSDACYKGRGPGRPAVDDDFETFDTCLPDFDIFDKKIFLKFKLQLNTNSESL